MQPFTPSQTAMGVALLRAAHQLIDGQPRILDDSVILRLLEPAVLERVTSGAAAFRTAESLALRAHVVTRSRLAEDRLEQAVADGVRQYLLLGAGLDTFAHRQPAWAAPLTIFEVDHPASHGWKRDRLKAAGMAAAKNVRYVSADLEQDSLADSLRVAGFNPSQPAFVSSLGVFMYLKAETVLRLIGFCAALPRGTELVFTFSSRGKESRLASAAAAVGEPWQTAFEPEEWRKLVLEAGFSEVEIVRPEVLAGRYFAGRSDALPPPTRATILRATK